MHVACSIRSCNLDLPSSPSARIAVSIRFRLFWMITTRPCPSCTATWATCGVTPTRDGDPSDWTGQQLCKKHYWIQVHCSSWIRKGTWAPKEPQQLVRSISGSLCSASGNSPPTNMLFDCNDGTRNTPGGGNTSKTFCYHVSPLTCRALSHQIMRSDG